MQGSLRKMTSILGNPVRYQLTLADQLIEMNPLLGKNITLVHNGTIRCIACEKKSSKSFNQGYCYPCFIRLAQCDMCIMKPEICHYEQGTCREPSWGEEFCYQPHIVYLANSSGIKVGITRLSQIPTRWIDQGATQALPMIKTASRHISGLIEVAIAKHVSDKTSWQKMLKQQAADEDLFARRDYLLAKCTVELDAIRDRFNEQAVEVIPSPETVDIHFPIMSYPEKIKSLCLTKTPEISGVLQGIKGQYLILDSGVINLRKYTGYEVSLKT